MTGPSQPRSVHEPPPEPSESTRPIGGGLSGVRVLVTHPGAELYGSDRVMLESVTAMATAGAAVEVWTVPAVSEGYAAARSAILARLRDLMEELGARS